MTPRPKKKEITKWLERTLELLKISDSMYPLSVDWRQIKYQKEAIEQSQKG